MLRLLLVTWCESWVNGGPLTETMEVQGELVLDPHLQIQLLTAVYEGLCVKGSKRASLN